jgi:hypothetical protein
MLETKVNYKLDYLKYKQLYLELKQKQYANHSDDSNHSNHHNNFTQYQTGGKYPVRDRNKPFIVATLGNSGIPRDGEKGLGNQCMFISISDFLKRRGYIDATVPRLRMIGELNDETNTIEFDDGPNIHRNAFVRAITNIARHYNVRISIFNSDPRNRTYIDSSLVNNAVGGVYNLFPVTTYTGNGVEAEDINITPAILANTINILHTPGHFALITKITNDGFDIYNIVQALDNAQVVVQQVVPSSVPAGPGGVPAGPGSVPAGPGSVPAGPGSVPAGVPTGPGSVPAGVPAGPGGVPAGPGGVPAGPGSVPAGVPGGVPTGPGSVPAGVPAGPGGVPAGPGGVPAGPGSVPAGVPGGVPAGPGSVPAGVPGGVPTGPGSVPAGVPGGVPAGPGGVPAGPAGVSSAPVVPTSVLVSSSSAKVVQSSAPVSVTGIVPTVGLLTGTVPIQKSSSSIPSDISEAEKSETELFKTDSNFDVNCKMIIQQWRNMNRKLKDIDRELEKPTTTATDRTKLTQLREEVVRRIKIQSEIFTKYVSQKK